MMEYVAIVAIVTLVLYILKRWSNPNISPYENENVLPKNILEEIVGKSTFVLSAEKNTLPESDSSGKMDIEIQLDYEPEMRLVEEQEELEHLGLSSEISSDITFEEMMEVVNEVENTQPKNPAKAGKLLYENDNTEWVEQMASTSSEHQKRIVALIDLHLGKLGQNEGEQVSNEDLEGFDIGEYI
ncbi:MAG TPA: hypothetical protein VKA38_15930 [Draconibacterium sp.]|nr:hypothetical protein [Draconibacterium sp.]